VLLLVGAVSAADPGVYAVGAGLLGRVGVIDDVGDGLVRGEQDVVGRLDRPMRSGQPHRERSS
jgi:hypothetical protein